MNKTEDSDRTIAAIATAPGQGGIGVIRISGSDASLIARAITKQELKPRLARFTRFYDQQDRCIDEGLTLFFPGPHSFTGEDVVEFQCHGSPIALDLLLARILEFNARMASPGEFSLRAFLHNKIDLSQAEAIADLIAAESVEAARSAVKSLQGEFSKEINALVEQLIYLRTFIEASLDFPEEDIEFVEQAQIIKRLNAILTKLTKTLAVAKTGTALQEGIKVLILGPPNVGKSSLLNALSGNDIAIVSPIAGTTRDLIKEKITLQGIPIHLIDTAGLRDSDDAIEQEGVRRAQNMIKQADIIVLVVDILTLEREQTSTLNGLLNFLPQHLHAELQTLPLVLVVNKIDLLNRSPQKTLVQFECHGLMHSLNTVYLSIKKQTGLALFEETILKSIGINQVSESTFIARRRHLDALTRAKTHLKQGLSHYRQNKALELLAEDCRLAQEALGEITGKLHSDELLGTIFSSFCIGK